MYDGVFCIRHADYQGLWRCGHFADNRIMKDKTFEISLQKHIQKMEPDSIIQDGAFTPDVTGEADRGELVNVMAEILEGVSKADILKVLNALPVSLAVVMQRAGANAKGKYRFDGKDLFTVTLKPVKADVGHGVAEGVEIAEHYALKMKANAGTKASFEALFNKPVTG